jgi:prefoldin subunit 5
MTTVTENDIAQINQRIDRLSDNFDRLSQNVDKLTDKIDKLAETVTQLAIGQVRLEENLNGQIKALEENLNGQIKTVNETIKGIDKRLDGIEILNRIVSGGFIVGILLALTKYLFFSGNNI